MRQKLQSVLKSWIFWAFGFAVLTAFATFFLIAKSPLNQDTLAGALRQEMLQGLEVRNFTITRKTFDLRDLEWTFELRAELERAWGLPVKAKDLTLSGSKKLFRSAEIKKAVVRFSDDEKNFKGGVALIKTKSGSYVWDLANLGVQLGVFQKKLGQAATLTVESQTTEKITAKLTHDGAIVPLVISRTPGSLILQIPKSEIATQKQRLPFELLNEIPSSGIWTVASRVEFREDSYSEASLLKVERALVSVAEMGSSLLRNGRGVGILTVDLSSSEGLLNGNFDFDLAKSTLELNDGKYFKVENAPLQITGTLAQSQGNLKIDLGDATLESELSRTGSFTAKVKNFDLLLLPLLNAGVTSRGTISGEIKGDLRRDLLGAWSLTLQSVAAERAALDFDSLRLPGLKISGALPFTGKFLLDVAKETCRLDGVVDAGANRFQLGDLYTKPDDQPMKIKLRAELESGAWTSFAATTEIAENQIDLKASGELLTVKLPKAFKWGDGLISGSLSFALCGGELCGGLPVDYSVSLSDFRSAEPLLEGANVSGYISKKGDQFEARNFTLKWPAGERLAIDGNLEKFKRADLSVVGALNLKNLETSNPLFFFKEYPTQSGTFTLALELKDENRRWMVTGHANYDKRKLSFDTFTLEQNSKNKYGGRLDINLEPYLLRNEAAELTSTLDSKGNLAAFEGLLMRGTYAAELVVASSGLNFREFKERLKLRASGEASFDQLPVTLLIGEGLATYAKEKQRATARSLAKCYPKRIRGKFDFDYSQGRWNLAPSVFQGQDRDSIVKLQGVLGDLSSINLVASYLPGPRCEVALADCLGDAFPKGGMTFEVTGAFKDPETDFDFAFIDQSLEKCREKQASRSVAGDSKVDTRDQRARIKELKDFYKTRKLDP